MKKTTIIRLTNKPYFFQKTGKRLLMLATALMITAMSFAQETDGDPGDGNPGEPDVPFDGGISLLIAAGVAYGAKNRSTLKNNRPITSMKQKRNLRLDHYFVTALVHCW